MGQLESDQWYVFQVGAREHYAVPRALHQAQLLHRLFTDTWVAPGSGLGRLRLSPRLNGRFHPELAAADVKTPRLATLPFELQTRVVGPRAGWERTMARNAWFQRWASKQLGRVQSKQQHAERPPHQPVVFSYSYAARSIFQLAQQSDYLCVLGQIDPGPVEEQLVAAEHRRYPQISSAWQPAPPVYWQQWADELALAHQIVVNSSWSWRCLQGQGVPPHKLRLMPLAYEPPQEQFQPQPTQPALGPSQPFQLLFLGTIGLRKGIARLIEAMRSLEPLPVQLTLAGPTELDPQVWAGAPNIRWLGPVPRSRAAQLYRQAHAMILPTLSDGFALTQLEALSYNCPVIASPFCGEVVSPGVNGWILPSLEPDAIAATIAEAMASAHLLPRPLQRPRFGLAQLAEALTQLPLPPHHG